MATEHNTGDTGAFGGPQDGTKILRVGHPVEHHQKGLRIGDHPIEVRLRERGRPSNDTLMGVGERFRGQMATADLAESDAELVGQLLDVDEDVGGSEILDHQNLPYRTFAGQQQFPDRLASLDLVAAETLGPTPAALAATTSTPLLTVARGAPLLTALPTPCRATAAAPAGITAPRRATAG